MKNDLKHVVVVGGGFAGINVVKSLSKDKRFRITLVDKNNYHFFPPLIYQVATAFIESSNITYPFRRLFQKEENIRFHMGSLLQIDAGQHQIVTDTGTLSYDFLILAHGTESNYFGLENIKRDALPMKTLDDAMNLRNHLLLNMEQAVRETNPAKRKKLLNIVIAGGGPTGVELAGMIAEMGNEIKSKEYPEIRNLRSHLYLVDASPVLLAPMSKNSQKEAQKVLHNLGVNIILNTPVKDYVNGQVILGNGRVIPTNVLIWSSGVMASEAKGLDADAITRGRRIKVNEYNQVEGLTDVFALGDVSYMSADPAFPNGHPQLAQVALQQGTLLGENLSKMESGNAPKAFKYNNKGSMAIIAKHKAVVDMPKGFIKGWFAWMIWLFIHIIPLVGFRNKARLAFSWLWSFMTNDPTLRLVLRPDKKENDQIKLLEDEHAV